jgi:hypothetical protein
MLPIREAPTSILRTVLRSLAADGCDTWSRRLCADILERRYNIFEVSEDGTEYGVGTFQHTPDTIHTERLARLTYEPIHARELPNYYYGSTNSTAVVVHETDAAYDVLFAENIRVMDNLYFSDHSDIHSELFESHNLLSDIQRETAALSANLDTFQLNLENPAFDIATTNQMGTTYELRLHVDQGTVEYDNAHFRCMRSDQFVFVNIRCRITRCDGVNMISIDLPYTIRADHVPFQATLKETESSDFSGMVRAYGRRGKKLYIESYVFRELPSELHIHGQYVTLFDEPFVDRFFQNPRPFTWITPMRYDTSHDSYLNRDMVHMLDVPDGSDLGFSDGFLTWTRVQDRVDLTGFVRFRQRTGGMSIPVVRCDIDLPFTLAIPNTRSHGYGATYATEYQKFLTERPRVWIRHNFRMHIDAPTSRLLFHEVVVQFHVSLFIARPSQPHSLEKPVVKAISEVENATVKISGIRMFDTWDPQTLFHTYNMNFRIINGRDEYQEYRFVPLTLELQYRLEHRQLDIFDIRMYNQLDDEQVEYLYPRRKEYHMRIHARNYSDEYQGPFELTPDFSTYLNVV